ncbi:MAG TPA: glutamyl-tRNA reductase [Panacibacter sp.]|nr:glutamyl-tRNA reductase [Panacibacter sp.]HNP46873.1 glutamyl-tRNA reductase [Panacibacter sp.]
MNINQFYIAGINYRKTDASVRGEFAIGSTQYNSLLERAGRMGLSEMFVLSTCNRTEIYGLAESKDQLTDLLCSETEGTAETFKKLAYIKQGWSAIEHLYNVAAGLDSQILGDYEVVGQIKQAAKFSKERGFIGTFLERLLNSVLQSSKAVKSKTELSGGTVSVSFAAIQFLKTAVTDINNKKIILLGTGKIGNNTCKNLVDYLHTRNITLINRTEDKAAELAAELNLNYASYSKLYDEVKEADVIIVATNAEKPVILKTDLIGYGEKVLIDMSIPNNIDVTAKELPGVTLVNVDDLSKINDATLEKRKAEVPRAKCLIAQHMLELREWIDMRRNVPVLKAVKQKLIDMHGCNMFVAAVHRSYGADININHSSETIQKVINNMAIKMKDQHKPGCNYIEAINDFITSRAC